MEPGEFVRYNYAIDSKQRNRKGKIMTTTESQALQPGQWIRHLGSKVQVIHIRKNGVTVGYWDRFGNWRKFRAASRYLSN